MTVTAGAGLTGREPASRWRGMRALDQNKTNEQIPATLRQRMQDMESTLTRMHTLLKQMRAKAAASSSKDPLAKANFIIMVCDLVTCFGD
jgi:hypothetical protein